MSRAVLVWVLALSSCSTGGLALGTPGTRAAGHGAVESLGEARPGAWGRLSGRVVDAYGGAPAVGAVVTTHHGAWIEDQGILGCWISPRELDTASKGATSTDAEGRYEFDRLLPGDYMIRVRHEDFAALVLEGVTVAAGRTLVLEESRLHLGGHVRGVVLGDRGHGAAEAVVQLTPVDVAADPLRMWSFRKTTTDERGRYRFDHVPRGSYWLHAMGRIAPGGSPWDTVAQARRSKVRLAVHDGGVQEQDLALAAR